MPRLHVPSNSIGTARRDEEEGSKKFVDSRRLGGPEPGWTKEGRRESRVRACEPEGLQPSKTSGCSSEARRRIEMLATRELRASRSVKKGSAQPIISIQYRSSTRTRRQLPHVPAVAVGALALSLSLSLSLSVSRPARVAAQRGWGRHHHGSGDRGRTTAERVPSSRADASRPSSRRRLRRRRRAPCRFRSSCPRRAASKRPSCGHWSKGCHAADVLHGDDARDHGACSGEITPSENCADCAELRQNCARGVPLLTNIGFFFDFFPLFLSISEVSSTIEHSSAAAATWRIAV